MNLLNLNKLKKISAQIKKIRAITRHKKNIIANIAGSKCLPNDLKKASADLKPSEESQNKFVFGFINY